jgi:predicted ATPase with chaperone activity
MVARTQRVVIAPPRGKTMLAKRRSPIFFPLAINEVFETIKMHSVAGRHTEDATLMTTPISKSAPYVLGLRLS